MRSTDRAALKKAVSLRPSRARQGQLHDHSPAQDIPAPEIPTNPDRDI